MMTYCRMAHIKSLKSKVRKMNAHVKQKSLARFSVAIILVVVLCVVRGCKTASDNDYHRPVVSAVETGPARKYEGIGTVTLKGPKTAEVLSYQT